MIYVKNPTSKVIRVSTTKGATARFPAGMTRKVTDVFKAAVKANEGLEIVDAPSSSTSKGSKASGGKQLDKSKATDKSTDVDSESKDTGSKTAAKSK